MLPGNWARKVGTIRMIVIDAIVTWEDNWVQGSKQNPREAVGFIRGTRCKRCLNLEALAGRRYSGALQSRNRNGLRFIIASRFSGGGGDGDRWVNTRHIKHHLILSR
jgi:hypothetical protein